MAAASKVGNWAFRAFTAGLGVATIYLAATFSVNVYRGFSWHSAQQAEKFFQELVQFGMGYLCESTTASGASVRANILGITC